MGNFNWFEQNKISKEESRRIAELDRRYATYFMHVDQLVDKGYLPKSDGKEIELSLAKDYITERFFIPVVNLAISEIENRVSKYMNKVSRGV